MGCFGSKKKAPPAKGTPPISRPVAKSDEPTSKNSAPAAKPTFLKLSPTFTLRMKKHEYEAVMTSTGLAVTVCEQLLREEDCRDINSEAPLRPDICFHLLSKMGVVFIATDATLEETFKFKSVVLAAQSRVKMGKEKEFVVTRANLQTITYTQDNSIRPGTPIIFEDHVVGLHSKSGCGVTINWICSELHNGGFDVKPQLERFLSIVQGEIIQPDPMCHVYSILNGSLVSFEPKCSEFLSHRDGLLEGAKMCYVATGLLIAGGLENGSPSARVMIYDMISNDFGDRKSMKQSRTRHCLCYTKNFVYCLSGETDSGPTADCEKYNVKMDSWDSQPTLPQLPAPRVDAGATIFKDVVYIVGGLDMSDVLRLQENQWRQVPSRLPVFRSIVLAESDSQSIFIFSQQLLRWTPESEAQEVLPAPSAAVATFSRLFNSSFYLCAGNDVFQARLDRTPTEWIQHKRDLPNFI